MKKMKGKMPWMEKGMTMKTTKKKTVKKKK